MMSLAAYKIFIWGVFTLGWIGIGVISVAAVLELFKLFRSAAGGASKNNI